MSKFKFKIEVERISREMFAIRFLETFSSIVYKTIGGGYFDIDPPLTSYMQSLGFTEEVVKQAIVDFEKFEVRRNKETVCVIDENTFQCRIFQITERSSNFREDSDYVVESPCINFQDTNLEGLHKQVNKWNRLVMRDIQHNWNLQHLEDAKKHHKVSIKNHYDEALLKAIVSKGYYPEIWFIEEGV